MIISWQFCSFNTTSGRTNIVESPYATSCAAYVRVTTRYNQLGAVSIIIAATSIAELFLVVLFCTNPQDVSTQIRCGLGNCPSRRSTFDQNCNLKRQQYTYADTTSPRPSKRSAWAFQYHRQSNSIIIPAQRHKMVIEGSEGSPQPEPCQHGRGTESSLPNRMFVAAYTYMYVIIGYRISRQHMPRPRPRQT